MSHAARARVLNRELSWLEFNARVLHEAKDERNPLLERLKFIAIFSANLDEFFMVRVAALRREVATGDEKRRADGRTPAEQLAAVHERAGELLREQRDCLHGLLLPELERHGVRLRSMAELNPEQWARLDEFFESRIRPLLSACPLGPGHALPEASTRAFGLAVELHDPARGTDFISSVKIPGALPRWVPMGQPYCFVPVEQVIGANLAAVFPDMEVRSWHGFRITRWADFSLSGGDTADLLTTLEEQVFGRRFAQLARVELGHSMPERVRTALLQSLREEEELEEEPVLLTDDDVINAGPLLQLSDLFALAGLDIPELRDPPFKPRVPHRLRTQARSFFDIVSERDVMVHHPYESFSASVERFLETAAQDERTTAISLTVYRTSVGTAIVRALTEAAQKGKQVTVLVELQARFDEAANIAWARTLERAGARVALAVPGLKTHAKLALVEREEDGGRRNYVHIGTGNYNARTARIYTDIGIFSARDDIGTEVRDLFAALLGESGEPTQRALLVSPFNLRERFVELIRREARAAAAGREARIIAKMNALVDHEMIDELYAASCSGVTIDLLVRGMCALRPGVRRMSETIRVVSIVGRFLEHSRAWYFENGGEPEYYIGSPDWMERNLDRRVEVVVPILDRKLRRRLRTALETYLADNRQAWDLCSDGSYRQRLPGAESERVAQRILIESPWGGKTRAQKLTAARDVGP